MSKRRFSGIILALLMTGAVMIFSFQQGPMIPEVMAIPSFVADNKLRYESGATYQWLDPHVAYYQYDYWILWHSVETLVWYNGESATEVIPWLAESWSIVDPTTYEFNLRQGITFQDGTPFNATAVWFSLNRLLVMDATNGVGDHGNQAGWTVQQLLDPNGQYFNYTGAEPDYSENWVQSVLDLGFVEIVGDYTVRLHLATGTTQLPLILAGSWCGIISPTETVKRDYEYKGWDFAGEQQPNYNYTKYFVHMAGNGDTYFNLPVEGWTFGTGAYYTESVDSMTYNVTLKAYDNYWGGPNSMNLPPEGKQRIETIEFIFEPSFATRLDHLKQGTATGISVAYADIFQVVDRDTWINEAILKSIIPDVAVHGPVPTLNTWWFDFNTNVTNADGTFKSWQPFSDWRMRMAVACSVNITDANIYINNRLSIPASNIIPPGTYPEGSYNPDVQPKFSFNLTKVEELITDLYNNPLTSATHDMYFYNGTRIPPGVVDNTFGPEKPAVVELYVAAAQTTFQQALVNMIQNLNLIARTVTGSPMALQFRVVIVSGGQQYRLASRHLIDGYIGGWIADYNHVLNWYQPMYYSRGVYPAWNQWNVTALDDLYLQAIEADAAGDLNTLLEINEDINTLSNEMLQYMVWWHDAEYYTRSSWLQGWYVNPACGVDLWSNMYYEPTLLDLSAFPWPFTVNTRIIVPISDPHGPCGGAHTMDTMGGILIANRLGIEGGVVGTDMDSYSYISTYDFGTAKVTMTDTTSNLVVLASPGVNQVAYYYNELSADGTRVLPVLFLRGGQGDYLYVQSNGHEYRIEKDGEGHVTAEYGVIQTYYDEGRYALIVYGLGGESSKATAVVLSKFDQWSLTGQAVIVKYYDSNADGYLDTATIVETIP